MVLTIPEKRGYKGAIVDERQWIHAIRKGNKEPLGDIAEKYYDDIWRFCAFQTGSREDAYDLAQETFVRFIRYVESYHDRNLKGYLLTIARNVCRDYLRRKHRETTYMWYDGGCLSVEGQCIRYGHGRGYGTEEVGYDRLKEDGYTHMEAESGYACLEAKSGDCGGKEREEGYRKAPEPTAGVPGQRAYGDPERLVHANPERYMYGNPEQHVYGKPEQHMYDSPEQRAVDADIRDRLMQALAQLPQMQREAILLHYLYDMKYREIGRVTDAQVSTVKSRVRQGMEKLQGLLRREDFLD